MPRCQHSAWRTFRTLFSFSCPGARERPRQERGLYTREKWVYLSFSIFCLSFIQKNSRRLWRSQRRKSRSVPEGEADIPAVIFLARKRPNLGRDSILCCRKIGEEFSSSVSKFAGKFFQQRISDSHSLLEFSDLFYFLRRNWTFSL